MTPLLTPRTQGAMFYSGGALFVVGGVPTGGASALTIDKWVESTGVSTTLPRQLSFQLTPNPLAMPMPDGKFLLTGQSSTSPTTARSVMFDPVAETVVEVDAFPKGTCWSSAGRRCRPVAREPLGGE